MKRHSGSINYLGRGRAICNILWDEVEMSAKMQDG